MPVFHRTPAPMFRLLLPAALLPLAASVVAVVVHVEPGEWLSMPLALRRGLGRDALLYTAGAALLAAPLAGIAAATTSGWSATRLLTTAATLAGTAAIFAASSAVLAVTLFGHADAWRLLAASHATMFAVTVALAAFGALCGGLFRDPLDAAACSLLVVLVAAGGVLVAGAALAAAPQPLMEAAVAASPLIAMASSSHIDIARMAVPYQMSPLAHLQVQYPPWYTACAGYLGFAALCLCGLGWTRRSWQVTTAHLKGQMQ